MADKQGVANRSKLFESASLLRRYLYLAQSNKIDEAISLASGGAQIGTNGLGALRLNQEKENAVRDIALQTVGTTRKDLEAVESDQDEAAPQTSGRAGKTLVTLSPGDFNKSLESGAEKALSSISKAEITHVVVKDTGNGINFSSRGAEYVALFSNLIPTVEMSKCVPYFRIKFIQNVPATSKVRMPFLVLDSFLGSARKGSTPVAGSTASDIPETSIVRPVETYTSRIGGTVSGMELFQAPQTLIRPNINQDGNYKAGRGIYVLDPMQPLASIESVNFDVSALSQNFMTTQTKIDMIIVLHDKSRMSELSPLLSPGIYPNLRAEVEWGWSHPDTNDFTDNPYAKFINALRSTQVFCVNSVSFSNRDTTSLSIKIQMTGLGEFTANNTSIYTGNYVSYELIRARMNQLFSIVDDKGKEGEPYQQKFVGAYEQVVSLSDWESSDKWIVYEHYDQLSKLIEDVQGGQKSATELVNYYGDILTNGEFTNNKTLRDASTPSLLPNLSVGLQDVLRKSVLGSSLETSPYVTRVYSAPSTGGTSDEALSPEGQLLKTIISDLYKDLGAFLDKDGALAVGPTTTFGDMVYKLFSIPMSATGLYDEIRVTTFDFNDHAARMAGVNIGSFPFVSGEVLEAVVKPKMNAQKALQVLVGLVNNASAVPYGLKAAYQAKIKAEEEAKKSDDDDGTDVAQKQIREKIQGDFDKAVAAIYREKAESGLGVSFESKFTVPRVKVHTEVTPVKDGNTYKQVLNVFIFDNANTGYRSANLLSSAIQAQSGAVRVFKPGPADSNFDYGVKATQDPSDGSWEISVNRATARRIITATIPTLRIGSEGSMITNASYNTAASGDLANLNILKGFKNSGGASNSVSYPGIDADMFVIPTSLSINMAGMPLVNRGQTYFVDFGTGTTLDNTYTVMSVRHSMKLGNFTTSINLNIVNQGSIASVTSKIKSELTSLQKYAKANLAPSTSS